MSKVTTLVYAVALSVYVRLKARQRNIMAYNHELIASVTSVTIPHLTPSWNLMIFSA